MEIILFIYCKRGKYNNISFNEYEHAFWMLYFQYMFLECKNQWCKIGIAKE